MGIAQTFDVTDARALSRPAAEKLLGLELLRFVSAMAVLLFHYRHFAHLSGVQPITRQEQPFYALLWPFYDYGQFGVQLFWGISGYIFFWKYSDAIRSGAVSATTFARLRFSRLYPLHLLTLLAVVTLQPFHRALTGADFVYPATDPAMFVRHLFMASDWGPQAVFSFNGPIWSVSAEVAVYAFFFLAAKRFGPSLTLCIGAITLGLGLQSLGIDWVSIACTTYFFAGGLAAVTKLDRKAALAMLVALLAAYWWIGIQRDNIPMVLLAAVPPLLVLLKGEWPWLDRWHRPIEAAGNLTYSTYLLHFPLQLMLAIAVAARGRAPDLASPLLLLAYLTITIIAGRASYARFELPAQRRLRGKAA